jgi:hypothetical protein
MDIAVGDNRAMGTRAAREEAKRRQARRTGALGFIAAAVAPWLLWHRAVSFVARDFRFDIAYLSGWVPWLLIVLGLLFLIPVTLSAGRDPGGRWYPRGRNAYAGWGVTLYILGCALALQVAQITQDLPR